MIKNQLTIVKEYEFDKPLIHKIDSIFDNCFRDCHKNYYQTFEFKCEYDIQLTNLRNNEIINLTISDKNMNLYELNKKLTVARQNGFIFNQINELTIKSYSNLSHINIQYYHKHHIPIMHRHFFRIFSKNRDYVQTHCTDLKNSFHFACQKWINQFQKV